MPSWLEAHSGIAASFGFLQKLKTLPDDVVVSSTEHLRNVYPTYLQASLSDELVQFCAFLKTEFAEKALDTSATSSASPAVSSDPVSSETSLGDADVFVTTKHNDYVTLKAESMESIMYKLIVDNKLETV